MNAYDMIDIIEPIIISIEEDFGVSKVAAKIRLLEAGYEEALGAFTYVDGKYKGDRATVDDDFATLNFEIDNNGKITAISWFYYPEQN